jgi:hypothetical protein
MTGFSAKLKDWNSLAPEGQEAFRQYFLSESEKAINVHTIS